MTMPASRPRLLVTGFGPFPGIPKNPSAEIARLVAAGLSNRDVAARLVLSKRTVESHVQSIFTKTGFTSRIHLALWYADHAGDG